MALRTKPQQLMHAGMLLGIIGVLLCTVQYQLLQALPVIRTVGGVMIVLAMLACVYAKLWHVISLASRSARRKDPGRDI